MSILERLGSAASAVSWPWERDFSPKWVGEAQDFAEWLWWQSAVREAQDVDRIDRDEMSVRQIETLYFEWCALEDREPLSLRQLQQSFPHVGVKKFRRWVRLGPGERKRVMYYRLTGDAIQGRPVKLAA